MGFKSKDVAGYIIEELNLPLTPEEFKQEITEIYRELFPTPIPCQVILYTEIDRW